MKFNRQEKILIGKDLKGLEKIVDELGFPKFTAKQIADWIYKKGITDIHEMRNISIKNRETLLQAGYVVGRNRPVNVAISADGTKKYLFASTNNKFIEAVYIPDTERATLCISSQAGCKMNCLFCMTGKQGFQHHLTAGEILNQVYSVDEWKKLTNIVYMGMGEPLDNPDEVLQSIKILTAPYGMAWSPKRITLSTIGVLPNLKRFLDETDCHLAVSLHNPISSERQTIMPVEKVFHLEEVIKLIKTYDFAHQRRISFEYILFKDTNDSSQHADVLAKLLRAIPCLINLIAFHQIPNVPLQPTSRKKMETFKSRLERHGYNVTIRASRGEDIQAACGMLSTLEQNKNSL